MRALGRLLARLFLPSADQEFILGDLEERHAMLTDERGVSTADRRYVRDAIASVWWRSARPPSAPDLVADVRRAARALARQPAATVAVVLTLAMGIGLASAAFAVADALLLQRIPVEDQDRLVVLTGQTPDLRTEYPVSVDDARVFPGLTRQLSQVASFSYEGAVDAFVREDVGLSRLRRAIVSGDYFAVLGSRPMLGRPLRPEDDAPGAARVMVLSHHAWQERFGGAPDVLGRRITMHEESTEYTVVGVMPPGLDHPRGTEAWVALLATVPEENLQYAGVNLIGRLAPGATVTGARDELTAYLQRDGAPTWQRDLHGLVRTLPEVVIGDVRPAVLSFTVAAAVLLLLACINVAGLLLVSGLARMQEVAVRSALGASRGRIVRQLLTENALLAAAGGTLGLLIGAAAVAIFKDIAPSRLPRLDVIAFDGAAVAGGLAITAGAMLLFGLAPAALTSRVDLHRLSKSGSRHTAGRSGRLLREALVAAQLALAVLVLAAAGVIGRSLYRLQHAELSFEPDKLMIAELAFPSDEYDTVQKQLDLLDRLLPAVSAIPGVDAVSPVVAAPFADVAWDGRLMAEGQSPEAASTNPVLNIELVAPDYFETLGIPVLRGRGFLDSDRVGSPEVVVISEAAALAYWPDEDPIGKRVLQGSGPGARSQTVIGVVPDTRYRNLEDARASVYYALHQSFFPFAPTNLALRTSRPPDEVTAAVRRALSEIAPDVGLEAVTPFDALLAGPLAQPRMNALLLAVFAGAAIILAAIGLFGALATMVRHRTRDLGVRMALGSSRGAIRWLVFRRGIALAGAGTLAGLIGALATNRLLATLLFEISPTDTATLGLVAVTLLMVSAVASLVPAWSGSRIAPAVALTAD